MTPRWIGEDLLGWKLGGGGGVGGSVDLTHLPPLIDRSFFPTFFGKEFDYPFQMLIIVIKHTIWLATNFPDL